VPPIGSRDASEISAGLRLFHLRHAKLDLETASVGRPRHFIAYRHAGPDLVVVVRVLHDAMNLPAKLAETDDE